MLDNQLFPLILGVLQTGMTALGQGAVLIQQNYQPTQQGTPSQPTLFVNKVSDYRLGAPYQESAWNETQSASFTGSIAGTTLTVASVASGALAVGQTIADGDVNIPQNVFITGLGTGAGGAGTYTLNNSLTVGTESMTAIPGMVTTYIQQYETTFQLTALATQNPANTTSITASDILNYAASVLQNMTTIQTLENSNVGILKIGDVRNPYFSDDRQRYEASPSFDFTLTHKQTILTVSPVVTETVFQILEV